MRNQRVLILSAIAASMMAGTNMAIAFQRRTGRDDANPIPQPLRAEVIAVKRTQSREQARRLKQIERGQLTASNGLAK